MRFLKFAKRVGVALFCSRHLLLKVRIQLLYRLFVEQSQPFNFTLMRFGLRLKGFSLFSSVLL